MMKALSAALPSSLSTQRLTLRLFDGSEEQYTLLLEMFNSPHVLRDMGDFGLRTRKDLDRLLLSARLRGTALVSLGYEKDDKADADVVYMATLPDPKSSGQAVLKGNDGTESGQDTENTTNSRRIIGCVSLAHRSATVPPDLGWMLAESHMGKGYATEMALALLDTLTGPELGINEIMAWPKASNIRSVKIAQRIGMVERGKAKDEKGHEMLVFVTRETTWRPDEGVILLVEGKD